MLPSTILRVENKTKKAKLTGNNLFQTKVINWSYLKRGKAALINTKQNTIKTNFKENQTAGDIAWKINKENKGCHPPKNKITVNPDIKRILAYSAKKNNANRIPPYSTL